MTRTHRNIYSNGDNKISFAKNYISLLFFVLFLALVQNSNAQSSDKSDISITVIKNNPTADQGNGSIKLKIEGGNSPYKIHCFSPYTLPTKVEGTELYLNNLKSGNYLFVIQDKSGSIVTKEVIIGEEK